MPERGGPTTQSGILYQNSIAALFLGRLLDTTQRPENERVVHVRVETPDAVDDIVITFADNHKVFIQAKEDIAATDTAWKNLWEDFDNQYQRGEFVKGIDKLALWVGSYRVEHAGLAEVCQRAISSETYDAWMSRITKEQKETLDKVKPLLRPELLEEATLLSFFKSLEVEIHAFKSVERDESVYWMPATNLYPKVLFRLLRDRVGGFARVRGEFTAYPLLNLLVSENPDLIFSKPTDFLELKRVIQSASSTLRHHKNTIGNTGLHIERCVVTEMVDWIINSNDDSKNLAMLVDQAGTGKTVALQDVQIALEAKGIDVLAIKADQQLSGICHLSDIDEKLGLAHPPEQILSRLAKAGRVVVLIDQIDALSLSLAHDQSTLDVVLDFIARLRRIPNLRILVSCRLFDRNSDHRIKEVDLSQQFALTNFTEGEISQVLNLVGKTFQDLQKPTQALLQIPLHLHLFALLLDNNTSSERLLGISNLQELYGAIWENIVLKDDPKSLSSKAGRVEVLRFIKNYMAQYQVTAVPQSALIQSNMVHLEPDIKWLASTGIIITGNQKWTFIHQTFFDYCFAREFVDQGENLANHVLRSEQGLFIRPLLTQVIAYMRGTDSPQYLRELKNLLYTQGIRFHLYDLLLRWFGSLQSPTDGEWL